MNILCTILFTYPLALDEHMSIQIHFAIFLTYKFNRTE